MRDFSDLRDYVAGNAALNDELMGLDSLDAVADHLVSVSAEHGFDVERNDLVAWLEDQAPSDDGELSDTALDAVGGGSGFASFWASIC
jgi:hypothetical protein